MVIRQYFITFTRNKGTFYSWLVALKKVTKERKLQSVPLLKREEVTKGKTVFLFFAMNDILINTLYSLRFSYSKFKSVSGF